MRGCGAPRTPSRACLTPYCRALQVQTRSAIAPRRTHSVDIPLTDDQIRVALNVNFDRIFRDVQHLIANIDVPDVRADTDGFTPDAFAIN